MLLKVKKITSLFNYKLTYTVTLLIFIIIDLKIIFTLVFN